MPLRPTPEYRYGIDDIYANKLLTMHQNWSSRAILNKQPLKDNIYVDQSID